MRSFLAKIFAKWINYNNRKWINNPIDAQKKTLKKLIYKGKQTQFGKQHDFSRINTYQEFVQNVPVRDYEGLKRYIEKIINGEDNVLWPGKPLYFSKTSGTTSGIKYIPISRESMPTHINASRDAILNYIHCTGESGFVNGKHIFLQGSPTLKKFNGILTGRLSGIVAHYVPKYLQRNNMPSWETNCIEDWEKKVDKIVEETLDENMTIIGGIPPWVQMYFEKIISKKKRTVAQVFKNFSLFVYGGVNFEPYRNTFKKLIGKDINTLEFYPASEGFFAYQNDQSDEGLLLVLNNGIFYEFIETSKFLTKEQKRVSLKDVEIGINYVMIISSNAGLWAYNVGDTVIFTSINPFKILVTGRLKHFISAFGEHVIGKEVEVALKKTITKTNVKVVEFTVAPQISPEKGPPYHEWLIEFANPPKDIKIFSKELDDQLQIQNIYYKDLIKGKILKTLIITKIKKNGFKKYMSSLGKLGGQNKVPRLSNDRKIANALISINY
ncbi:MAG: GH3 auxin-responsive promoter family protein [Flavobacteriaceae bacterium]|nr:GH3 auxin-responsive promoter family protein [Flavobacteriaceae bacterium]